MSQHVLWEGKEELEPLPVAEPLWLIDVLEHRRARHGGTAEHRGDLVVDVGEEDVRIRLDEPE